LRASLIRTIFTGLLTGLLMGFIDTYGYAVTGYTTSELAGIVASILYLVLYVSIFREYPSILEHFLGVVIAFGSSLSTAITSGMYITYTMLAEVGDPHQLRMPSWMYFTQGSVLSLPTYSFYLYATAISASGALIAYVFHKHFIDKEKLPFPVGGATAIMVEVSKALRSRGVIAAVLTGLTAEFLAILAGNPSLDLTPELQTILPGSSIGLSLNIFIFLFALLIPLNTSVGIGLGNFLTFLILTPALAGEGLLLSLPTMSYSDLTTAAAPYTASMISGFIIIASAIYIFQDRRALKVTFKYISISRYLIKYLLISVAMISSAVVPVILVSGITLKLAIIMPFYILLQLFLALITIRVVGEAGTASQSTLPLATLTLFAAGGRSAIPYAFLDPYTGVPMPQFVAGAAMNAVKAGKSLDIDPEVPVYWLMLSMLIAAPITLYYGYALLSVFGLHSSKLNLLRWVPVVTWMNSIFSGNLSSFNPSSILIGAVFAASIYFLLKYLRMSSVSLYAILIGTTLTPDIGLLFLTAAAIKYVALRIGTDVYEGLIAYSALALAGAGLGVALSVIASLTGVV